MASWSQWAAGVKLCAATPGTPNATLAAATSASGASASADLSASCDVFRLRPNTDYDFHVYVSSGGGAAVLYETLSATVPATGLPRFDQAPLAQIAGGTPSWQMLTMSYEETTADHIDQHFYGIVAVDQAGWLVWYYPVAYNASDGGHGGTPGVWDFLPEADGYSMVLLEVGYDRPTTDSYGVHWTANSALSEVAPDGSLQTQYVQSCTGGPMNYNQMTHELRVDTTDPDRRVLTTQFKMAEVGT